MMGYQDRLGTKTYVQQVEHAARFGGAVSGGGHDVVDPQILRIVTNRDMLTMTDDVQQPTLLPSQVGNAILITYFHIN
jgi:hypothetical protein